MIDLTVAIDCMFVGTQYVLTSQADIKEGDPYPLLRRGYQSPSALPLDVEVGVARGPDVALAVRTPRGYVHLAVAVVD